MNKETYTEDEVQEIVAYYIAQTTQKVAGEIATFCDKQRGYLTIGYDIRKNYNITSPEDPAKPKKPSLRLVK